jgi:uncharacterized protein YodC (DUF2158 family)
MEFNMLAFTNRAPIATAFMLGIVLSVPLSTPVFSESAPSNTMTRSQMAASLQRGDLVRLRSGGPLMTVDSIKGNQADCFWTGEDGQPNAESFPVDVLQRY